MISPRVIDFVEAAGSFVDEQARRADVASYGNTAGASEWRTLYCYR